MKAEFQFTPEDLQTLRGLIREELQAMQPKETKYLSRKEAADKLKISLPTLSSWVNKGMIRQSKLGNRVLFEEQDVQSAILKQRG